MNELLSAEDLPEDLQKERELFYNRCPVDMSPGTVNRIAWAVNKKFDDFENLPLIEFDKEIIKSGVLYDKSDVHKVREVYQDYKNSIINLSKKINTDEITEDDGFFDMSVINLMFKGKFYEVCPNMLHNYCIYLFFRHILLCKKEPLLWRNHIFPLTD